jgi:DNA modification methylase
MSSYEPGSAADPVTVSVLYGDAWALAETLKPQSIDCIVTSPPYWGLRDYGHPEQFGLERTPQEYVAKLVDLFARLRPALKDEGTVWLNLGDCYATSISTNGGYSAKSTLAGFTSPNTKGRIANDSGIRIYRDHGLKPKDLVGIPWRVAFALQEDGWYLRSDIIWAKPNPMPESVTDRPTKAHEYIFLLAKSERYYFDQDAVKEPAGILNQTATRNGRVRPSVARGGFHGKTEALPGRNAFRAVVSHRNIRTVWTITTKPYKGAHFATFPPQLIEPCIKASTSERGVCPKCGKAWERITEKPQPPAEMRNRSGETKMSFHSRSCGGGQKLQDWYDAHPSQTVDWQPTCACGADPIPATVLDPFMGSGTTAEVARKLGRNCIGFELNENYRPLIDARVAQAVGDLRCRS